MQNILIIIGLVCLAAAALWPLLEKSGLGRLPGDIVIEGENYGFYFPVITCLLVSILLSAAFWFFNK
ncbi:MAG: hypothetical protein CMH27_11175 [Micavibrio sp.]|nr:hypothetical protein [Micavibrio sp.]|tara:strand:- start:17 stop:217 length:201 start_codon:yes stop_codon:yes gene_type:complete